MTPLSSSRSRIASALPVAAAALLGGGVLIAVGCGGGGDGGGDGGGPTPPQPNQSPTASIDRPADGNGYAEPDTVFFEGSGSDAEDGSLSGGSLAWESSVDGELDTGTSFSSTALSAGDHTVRLIATDSDGAADTASVSISVIEPGNIAASSGGGQDGKTTREFENPLVVTLTDADGNPAAGVEVRWSVADGEVSLGSSSTRTDDNGEASVTVTSDTLFTDHTVEATSDFFAGGPASFDLETTEAWFRIGDDFFQDWQNRRNTSFEAEIPSGTTVEWEHTGSNTHSVTSGEGTGGSDGSGVPAGGTEFDSPDLSGGDTYRQTFSTAGTWTYYCRFHETVMYDAQLIVVADGSASAASAEGGTLAASDLEPGDVIAPEGSPFVFVYQGPPGSVGER